MNSFRRFFSILVTALICSNGYELISAEAELLRSYNHQELISGNNGIKWAADTLETITRNLYKLLRVENYKEAEPLVQKLESVIGSGTGYHEKTLAYPLYLIGFYKKGSGEVFKSFHYYNRALAILDKYPNDSIEGNVYYNLGTASNSIGDDVRSDYYFSKSLYFEKKDKDETDPELVTVYLALAIANINIRNNDKALSYTNRGLAIVALRPEEVTPLNQALLYQTKATALARISDYYQAVINYSIALKIYESKSLPVGEYYINLINNLAVVYFSLGNIDRALEIYEKGLKSCRHIKGLTTFNLASSYAYTLARMQKKELGEKVIKDALADLQIVYNENSREYIIAVTDYADYLREFGLNYTLSMELFRKSFDYVSRNPWDLNLRTTVSLGYARGLMYNNKPETALDSVSAILYREAGIEEPGDVLLNPDQSQLNDDKRTLNILRAKYDILRKINGGRKDLRYIESEAVTAGLIIEIIESIRINIGEEQSRILLGDNFRDAYLNVISSYLNCYNYTGKTEFLEKAFEFSERSKAASLLASIREMKAKKTFIPAELVAAERKILEEIGFYTAKYEAENNKENPVREILSLWELSLARATDKRDSLRLLFQTDYKGFYDLKYNTRVTGTEDAKRLLGRNKDYLSYIVSDSLLFILVVNRNVTHLETVRIDSGFKSLITSFRKLISEPDRNDNARREFDQFQKSGHKLYSILIEPVERYFVSRNLVISPDNLLSFFPFDALITSDEIHNDLFYSRLSYLMNDFRISYAYSATLLSESERARPAFRNTTLALAPSYDSPIFIDSISVNRQQVEGILTDLIYARDEAEFVSDITSGVSYIGKSATKDVYEREAGSYDILHLAMHTVLKTMDPINSGMIFAESETDSVHRYLRPFEIYTVPLDAKMVVLSSCYTGAGTLYAGEGVLSLARGFIFSGSRSVVMSLWEVNDRAGTEIIKAFYRHIKSGKRKSEALRIARMNYLKNADMLLAHPYYWSTLVNYGDDSPLYISSFTRGILILLIVLMGVYIFSYLRKR